LTKSRGLQIMKLSVCVCVCVQTRIRRAARVV
jgi:hypothetical protein